MSETATVLYIDDERQLPAGFEEALRDAGYNLLHTAEPDEALMLVRVEEIDLVLAEIVLSSCNGIALLEEIRSYGGWPARVPIIVLTKGERSPDLYGGALELGVKEFFTKPALKMELLESVQQFAGTVLEPTDVDPVEASSAPEGDAAISGDLSEIPISEVLRRLRRVAASGVLTVTHRKDRKAFELRNGSPLAASASGGVEAPEEFLARRGRISQEQRRAVKERVAAGKGSSGEILIVLGVLSPQEFNSAICEQAEEQLLETFGWTSGAFHYFPDKHVRPDVAREIARGQAALMLDGARRWSPQEVVAAALRPLASLYVSRVEEPPCELEELGLSSSERAVFEDLYGGRRVQEVLASGDLEARTLYGLFAAGLLVLHEDPVMMLLDAAPVVEEPPREVALEAPTPEEPSAQVCAEPPEEDLEDDLDDDLDEELDRDLAEELDEGLGLDLEEDPDEELVRDLEKELGEGLGLDLEESLDEGLDLDLEQDPDEGLGEDLEEELDEGLGEDLEEELDEGLGEDLEEELDQDLAEELEEAPEEEPLSGPVIILEEDATDAAAKLPPPPERVAATPVLEPPPPARVVATPVPGPSPTPEAVPTPVPPTPAPPAESLAPSWGAERALAELTAFCEHIRDEDDFDVLGIDVEATDAEVQYAYDGLIDTLPSEAAVAELPALKDLADEARKRIDRAFDRLRLGSSRKVYAQLRPVSVKGRKKPEPAKTPEQIAAEEAAHIEALAARGLDAESWFRRGDSFFEEKSYGQAVEAYGMAAHLDPKEGEYLARLGFAQFRQNPKDAVVLREALENIAKGIKLAPKQEKPYVYLGKIFRENGAAGRARKMFENAVRIKPDCQEALQELRLLDLRQAQAQAKGGNLLGRLKGILD